MTSSPQADESSHKNNEDVTTPRTSEEIASNPTGAAPVPPLAPDPRLASLRVLLNRLQAPDVIDDNGRTPEQRTQHQAAAPSTGGEGTTTPEAMLSWLQSTMNNMMDLMVEKHVPPTEVPSATLPNFLRPADRPRTSGVTYNPSVMAKDGVNDLFGMARQAFGALDAIQAAITNPNSRDQTIPDPGMSSRQGGSPFPNLAILKSLADSVDSSSPSPGSRNANAGAIPNTPPAGFDIKNSMLNSTTRLYQTNPLLIRTALQQIARHLRALPEDDPSFSVIQCFFGLNILHLYEAEWDDKNLEAGVSATLLALAKVPDPGSFDQYIPTIVRSWAYGQRLLVQRDGDVEKLAAPIALLKSCWETCKGLPEIPDRAKGFMRTELGACLFDQYAATGNLDDLNSAIEHFQALSEADDNSTPVLFALGLAHYERFLQCGDLDDLDRALFLGRKGSGIGEFMEPQYDPDTASGRHLFGLALVERFKMTLDVGDLDKAITNLQKAIALLSPTHPLVSPYKASLARVLFARHESLQDFDDLQSALDAIQSALSLDKGSLGRHTRVPPEAIQGYLMAVDGETRKDLPTVQNGIRLISTARKAFSGPTYLESHIENYLAKAMTCRFRLTTSNDDLELAIPHASLAFEKAHEGSPYRFQYALEFGQLLMTSFQHTNYSKQRDDAIAHFCSVAMSSTWPSIRLDAAIQWADAAELSDSAGVVDALEIALSILPSLAWAGNRMPTQYRILAAQKSAIASRAAVHALDAGDPAKAVSYLESGRNILWAQALQLRSEHLLPGGDKRQQEFKMLSEYLSREVHQIAGLRSPQQMEEILQGVPPERLRQLPPQFLNTLQSIQGLQTRAMRRLVEIGGVERVTRDIAGQTEFADDFSQVYKDAALHNAAKRWETLRSDLDELSGMFSPARSSAENDLVAVLKQGSIVILNSHGLRCDAIIISVKKQAIHLKHVPLPDMSGDEIQAWAEALRQGMDDVASAAIKMPEYEEIYLIPILRNLWKGLARPILEHLTPSGHAKRVWWYPTGPLAFLPIHAASPCEGEQPGLPELIISSYIPSIHSLVRASKSPSAPFRLLAVGQPETPGFIPLPGVIKEVQSIQKLCQDASPESLTTIIGEEATVYKVLSSLPGHTSLHFSCHADQDEEYPFHSAFFLQNGALKLSKLMDLDLSRVQFTFLSACLTSAGDVNLPDECIHLSAGMQFAGVRSVVGTMWTVYDRASAMATSRVYRHLLRNGIENADASEAAEALHKAVLWMKKNNVPVAYRVPFIHLGV